EWKHGHADKIKEMKKQAMEKDNSVDTVKVALALEGMVHQTPYGEVIMRKEDHQLLQPLYISRLTKDVKYDAEQSGLGFSTIESYSAEETAIPVACQVQRPK